LYVAVFAITLLITVTEKELHKRKPYKDLFILSSLFLLLVLGASFESLTQGVRILPFLPIDFVDFLMVVRSYQLMLMYPDIKSQPKIRDLSSPDQILIASTFVCFFVFLFLAGYYLGWTS
jgi:hypothetical protein